ncbi:MAG: hypothetical protein HY080_07220 [Gammaproteobacteria bacterium]|nr:hypothetical protein [Gammaproteobacteria bacterium]
MTVLNRCIAGLSIVLSLTSIHGFAQDEIETIDLHHRSSEDIIPVLQPLVKPGGSLTGTGYKLIIRSTPDNIDELKHLLADIDIALKQLVITVATTRQMEQLLSSSQAQVVVDSGDIHAAAGSPLPADAPGLTLSSRGDTARIDAHITQTQQHQDAPSTQQMRVVEGTWGSIQMGQAVPIMTRQRNPDGTVTATVTYKNVTSGFQVLPRTHGEQVTLQIRPSNASINAQNSGAIDVQSMQTTVTGKLGEWISLGGNSTSRSSERDGMLYTTKARSSQQDQLWVKVEVASP